MNTYARKKIQELGLFTKNNSRGDYNGTGYGDYGQKVGPSMPVPQGGGKYGWMPNNPEMDQQFTDFYNSYGLNIPQGTKSLYMAPPSGVEQQTVGMAPLQGGVEEKAKPMGLLMQELMGLKPQGPAADELRSRLSAHFGGKGGGRQARVNSAGRITSTAKKGAPPGKYFPEIDGPSNVYQPGEILNRQTENNTIPEDLYMPPTGQSMQSSKRPGMLLKPQSPMMDNSGMQQRTGMKQSKGFGTLPNMPKKTMDYQQFQAMLPPGLDERVAGIKARAAAEDQQANFPMYVGSGDENKNWQIQRMLSPEESSQRLSAYMGESGRSRSQATADLKELALRQEAKHIYFSNQQRAAQGLPPIRSINRQQFAIPQQPSNAGWHAAGPHGWLEPGGQINRSDVPAIDSGYGFPGAGQQPMPQYQPQFMPQPMQQPMAPQPMPQRPPVDVDQLIEAWNNIKGPKAPLAHFIENSKRSAGELPSFIPPDAQAMMNSPSGGPVGAPGGYAQPDVANPMVRDAISRFFMNGMRGNNDQMNNQERMINQRARVNQVDSMMGNVAAPVMGGLMSMFTGGGAGNEMAQDWNNKAYQRGNDLMNQRNQFINNAQQNTRDGFSMMQSSDPNTMKNQIAMMNAQANAQRANSYGQQVGNQGILGMGNLDYKNRELGQRGNQFTVEMAMKAKQMDQQLSMHLDDVKLRAQSNQISQQQANQEMQIAVMRNEQAKQQMAQQMQIATMGNAAQMRGQDFNAYNNYLGNQGANMRQAAALHWDKDGNPHPSSEEWFRQMFGAPAPPVQQTPVEAPNPISQFFGFGGQPQQAQNPVIETALQHYQSLPPQQRAALRPQFIQKFGQDPGN